MADQQNYEKLGAFYLGRTYDLARGEQRPDLLLYDSKDLVTHAACFGMTGSGKTGLCVVLLEEAAIDGIPAIVIDPKGDLTNLLLTFPGLRPESFAPWVAEDAARRQGLDCEQYAAQQAELWKKGLASWDQDGSRVERLRAAADFAVYTPGSDAGLPVSLLKSFDAPSAELRADRELMRERLQATVTSLLGLLGVEADPVRSREHILLSLIFDQVWQQGRSLDLAALIQMVQNPPVSRVGMLDMEAFFPSKDRFGLAMMLNNLLASPGFEAWLDGEPLDIDRMLRTAGGKPRVSIFSIAHLSDTERMFFVSMLLNQAVNWMRGQSGTSSLRALLYMDETFGYFPPVANPPSKAPLLTLLKQARSVGLGVVLATQNPMDLDYKGLSNCGTWLVGRLQTDRDQRRVLDGLAGTAAGAGAEFDRQAMEQTLAGLGKRVFLMYNVHETAPEIFESRWALSYLCGPLTREQIKTLMAARKEAVADATEPPGPLPTATPGSQRPVLPPEVPQSFLPLRSVRPDPATLAYEPMLVGCCRIQFIDSQKNLDYERELTVLTPLREQAAGVDWKDSTPLDLDPEELEPEPYQAADYGPLPAAASIAKSFDGWKKRFVNWVYADQRLVLYRSPTLKENSNPAESERDFRIRLEQRAREERDLRVQALRKKYAPKIARLEEKIRRSEAVLEREQSQAKQEKLQSAISVGASLLGAFLGRKVVTVSSLGRARTAARSVGRASKEAGDVGRAAENLEAARRQLAELEAEFQAETDAVEERIDPITEQLETVEVRAKKTNIMPRLVGLAWAPYWRSPQGELVPAWK